MDDGTKLADIAAQLADRSRVTMVLQLMDGSSRTATELAFAANLSASSASMHLAKLVHAKILTVTTQGRNKYYRIANPTMAHAVEALAVAANWTPLDDDSLQRRRAQLLNPWAFARTCFDHLAGRLGVELALALQRRGFLKAKGPGYELTPDGEKWTGDIGIDCEELKEERRAFATQCLDWSERRSHIGGALGAALLSGMFKLGWLGKSRVPRLVRLTSKGESELRKELSLVLKEKSKSGNEKP